MCASSENVTSGIRNTCSRTAARTNVSIQPFLPPSLLPPSLSHWMTTTLSIKGLFKGAGRRTGVWNPDLTGNRVLKNLLVRDSNFCEQPANPGDYRVAARHRVKTVRHKWSPVAVNSNYMPCRWYDLLWSGASTELQGASRLRSCFSLRSLCSWWRRSQEKFSLLFCPAALTNWTCHTGLLGGKKWNLRVMGWRDEG